LCLDNAKILSQALSYNHAKLGLDFSERISKAAPDFKNIDISPELSFYPVINILKHIININETLSFSNKPLFTYL